MIDYFKTFMITLIGDTVSASIIAELLVVALSISVLYLLTKLVFPTDTVVKKAVFIALFVISFIAVLYSNGITLLTITQVPSTLGVLV